MSSASTRSVASLGLVLLLLGCDQPGDDGPSPDIAPPDRLTTPSSEDGNEAEGLRDREGEPCEELEVAAECDEGMHNVCDLFDGERLWGPCHQMACEPGDHWSCGEIGTGFCEVDGGITTSVCEEGTPLVLSFDGAEPSMVASPMATFDVGTDGACIQTDWPTAATPWLALDRDQSGSIDGGHELFGSGTVLADGTRAQHGFLALGELDSNGDGRISAADERFGELVLWSDVDGDKRSTSWEHTPLAARGILSIELGWTDEPVCDARGNCGVERASFSFIGAGGAVSQGQVIDVHLACQ